jgi:cellulose synthase/poly-beta-1,6-N-acetylglucosamine synthase-like glycosyltransferase
MINFLQILLDWLFIASLFYFALIMVLTLGWYTMKTGFEPERKPQKGVSVVIALRNEEDHVGQLLKALSEQTFPKELLEIILIDDHSEDNTINKIELFRQQHPEITIHSFTAPSEGKKKAVAYGVSKASYDFVLLTDGDTIPEKRWIRKMSAYYEEKEFRLVLGPVVYDHEKGFLQKLFSLEFLGLVASGAGAAGAGIPFMGNAANMGFDKKVFTGIPNEKYASGDDVFLIQQVKKRYGKKAVGFLKDNAALVKTTPPRSLKTFFRQRLRWGSKAKGYKDPVAIAVSLLIFFYNLGLASMFIFSIYYSWLFIIWALFIIFKTLTDLPLVQGYARLTQKTSLLVYTFLLEILFPFYITFTGLASLFIKYQWKGRKNLT